VAGQSLIRSAGLLVFLIACRQEEAYEGAFQVPVAAAVLQPEVGGPFQEPVGFVANGHGGQIVPLALKQGRFLTDDPTISFLRTNPLPTGGLRRLTSVAVVPQGVREVVLWAGDAATGSLLRVPYLYDCELTPDRPECETQPFEGAPVEQAAYWEILETPGDHLQIEEVAVKKGYSTTELWTILYEGGSFSVEGSRSGLQPERAVINAAYSSEYHRLGFRLQGEPQDGDRFVVRTESGLSEHDVGGTPLAVSTSPDQSLLALIVHRRTTDRPVVRWFDPQTREVTGEVTLADDAWPHRLAWSEDGALLVADRDHPAIWEVGVAQTTALEHPMPWPTLDVASLDGPTSRRLFVVPVDSGSVWLFDRDTDTPLDINALVPGEQGLPFTTTVLGIEALRRPHLQPEYTDDEVRLTGRSVAVVLADNRVVFAHEETGCLVQDSLGPRTEEVSSGLAGPSDYETNYLDSVGGAATLELQGASGRNVSVNTCAGIAPSESWTLTFDQNQQAWRVEGQLSGEQQALAIEDERYVSDNGEVSFVIRSGITASRDGWSIQFQVDIGAAEANGDNDLDGISEFVLGIAADPVYFEYQVGHAGPIGDSQGEGWLPIDIRPFVLVPAASSNEVGRVDPQEALIEVGWE
jgi:hypothetical protein